MRRFVRCMSSVFERCYIKDKKVKGFDTEDVSRLFLFAIAKGARRAACA